MSSNKIILGTAQFGIDYGINNSKGKPSFHIMTEVFDKAFAHGIRFLDTAEAYGDSQLRIGKYHRSSNNNFKIITKYSKNRNELPDNIYDRVRHNIQTLYVDKLYCYMFHNFQDYIDFYNDFKDDLQRLKSLNLIEKIGVSLHTNEEIEHVLNNKEIDLIQLPFNLLDNSSLREKILLKAKNLGFEIHTRSVFLQGLFFKDSNSLKGNLKLLKNELIKISNEVRREEINDLALNYVFNKKFIDGVLVGVDNLSQLDNNLTILKNSNFEDSHLFKYIDSIKVSNLKMLNPVNWKL